jgi:hypothetical protein
MHMKSIALFLAAVPWIPSPSLSAQGVRVHPPLVGQYSDVRLPFHFAVDGRRVYSHDNRLFSAVAGRPSSVVALDAGAPPGEFLGDIELSSDRRMAIWNARASYALPYHTYVAPVDGTAPAVQVSSLPVWDPIVRVFPDWVLAPRRDGPAGWNGLLRVHLDGTPTRTLTTRPIREIRWTAAGDWVVFRTHAEQEKLFSVPTEAGAEVALYEPPAGEEVTGFALTLDDSHVVFETSTISPSVGRQLLRVPIDGSAPPILLSGAPHEVESFELTPDGLGVVYAARNGSTGPLELFGVPIDRSSPPVSLSALPVHSSSSSYYGITDGVPHLVHVSAIDLHSTAIGSGTTVQLNGALSPGQSVHRYLVSPDGAWVVFHVSDPYFPPDTIHSVPTDGSRPAVLLHAGGEEIESDRYAVTPTGYTLYLTRRTSGSSTLELHSAPIDGSRPSVRLHAPLGTGSVQTDYAVTRHGYVVFRASQEATSAIELFAAPVDGSRPARRISSPMGIGGNVDIDWPYTSRGSFEVSPDGWSVLYRADQEEDDKFELFETWIDPVRAAGPP